MIPWPEGVNKFVLRESSWSLPSGYIEDETKSGKKKRRASATMAPTTYKCTLHMTYTEYVWFKQWYMVACRKGTMSFALPAIDSKDESVEREYRFAGKGINVSNPGGDVVKLTFDLEEVV